MPPTISELLRRSDQLAAVSDTPRLDVEVLLCHLLGKDRAFLYTWPDHQLNDARLADFYAAFERRKNGEPVAYIIGQREFWSLPLEVEPSTLIPRPETELLVEVALDLPLPEKAQVLDLGTGTGAIALALASERSGWQVDAVDVVEEAVALAERNRQTLQLNNARVWQSCWFQCVTANGYHLIVSNPPYIDPQDAHLQQGDVRFEPRSALVAQQSGLADIETIIACAPGHLQPGGWLLFEHGYDQGEAVQRLLTEGGFKQVETRQDLAGNDRVSLGCYSGQR
ncbi:peptide chain release factor N(5)-glutamine methyltransferase [Porticoccus sp. W117]|uniref:peptide chain release factor N(5)-glutamine methyltransferase n=1 Tax=Porticoccus sp. W117 TaxID=3054777 RepID=UPI0025930BBB|nr:peptide chain release factor N(5)-glutamine methyltransferase [Porticoccus sp. W117]MDM3871536.1 peptide chain release factor N(5)-glutamine methyltransferase [Porticoccus sp. W117]